MALLDGCGIPRRKSLQLGVDPGNRCILADLGQGHQTARQVVAALAVFCLLGLVEIISRDDIDWFFQQGQIAEAILVVVVDRIRVLCCPHGTQLRLRDVGQDVLDFQLGEGLETAWGLQAAERHLDVLGYGKRINVV